MVSNDIIQFVSRKSQIRNWSCFTSCKFVYEHAAESNNEMIKLRFRPKPPECKVTNISSVEVNWRLTASLSWYRAPIWSPWPDFCFLSDDSGILDVGHPLWREAGSVIYLYKYFWDMTEQALSGPCPAELTAIFYCIIWDSPNLEGQVPVLTRISPRKRVAQLYQRALAYICHAYHTLQYINSVALLCERTIPTERPSLVGEVSANFADRGVSHGQCGGSLTAIISVS
jgi:hypothetical protein